MSGATGTSAGRSKWEELQAFFRDELKSRPGRLRAALVRVAATTLALWIGLGLNLPEMSAVMALAFFASSPNRDECKKVALGVPPAVFVILLLLTFFLNVFGATPFVRTIAFIVIIFSSLFLLRAAQAGAIFLLAAIFGKVFLSLWDTGLPTVLVEELQLWIVADIALAGLCALFACYVFGNPPKNPVVEFRRELACRFDLLSTFFSGATDHADRDNVEEKVRAEALSASDKLLPLLEAAKKKDSEIRRHDRDFVDVVRLAVLLLHQSVASEASFQEKQAELTVVRKWLASRCAAIAQAIRSGKPVVAKQEVPMTNGDALASAIVSTVTSVEDTLSRGSSLPKDPEPAASKKFLRPDAFSNPAYLDSAFRATTAAFVCYCLIGAANYSGIGTAVTTCLITALTTVEQTRQKQSLRIFGAILGGILGFVVIGFVLPEGTGLAGLTVITALVTFLGAWIYAGSPRLSYAGVQLVLCFFLGVFGENATPTSLTSLRDRVVGILIGNIAMWLFYDRIQPVWTTEVSRSGFADELLSVGKLAGARTQSQESQRARRLLLDERKAFLNASTGLKEMGDSRNFEFNFFNKLQRKKAPLIRSTELHLQQLFSFQFAAVEADLLRLTSKQSEGSVKRLSDSLLTLSSLVRRGNPIGSVISPATVNDSSPDELLLRRVNKQLSSLFPAGTKPDQ